MKTITSLLVMTVVAMGLGAGPVQADDINALFQQGRTAYYKGDFELAKKLLDQVQAANPSHFETKAILAQIAAQAKKGGSLQKQYGAVTIPKFEVTDATLAESLQALAILAKKASDGKVQPNLIIKTPELGNAKITLALHDLPMTEVIRYLAEMASAKVTWDLHAVVLSSAAD